MSALGRKPASYRSPFGLAALRHLRLVPQLHRDALEPHHAGRKAACVAPDQVRKLRRDFTFNENARALAARRARLQLWRRLRRAFGHRRSKATSAARMSAPADT